MAGSQLTQNPILGLFMGAQVSPEFCFVLTIFSGNAPLLCPIKPRPCQPWWTIVLILSTMMIFYLGFVQQRKMQKDLEDETYTALLESSGTQSDDVELAKEI